MIDMLMCGAALALPLAWWWRHINKSNDAGRERGWWL